MHKIKRRKKIKLTAEEYEYLCACELDYLSAARDLAKDIAKEIFEEIEQHLIESNTLPDCARLIDLDYLATLKRKYIGE